MGTVGCVPKASPRKARKPRRPRQERRTLIYKAVESCAIHADLHRLEVDGRLQRYADIPADDFDGRKTGSTCGKEAWELARQYFRGAGPA